MPGCHAPEGRLRRWEMSDSDESSSYSTEEEAETAPRGKRVVEEFDYAEFRAVSKRARLAEDIVNDFQDLVTLSGEMQRVIQVFHRIDAAAGDVERKLQTARREPLWRLDAMFERQAEAVEGRRLAVEARAAARDLRRSIEDVLERRPGNSPRPLARQLERACFFLLQPTGW